MVHGDVLGIEILEQGAGRAIDELTVVLPAEELISLLSAEIDDIDGVSVENIRQVEIDRIDSNLTALAVGAAMAECDPDDRLEVLCAGLQRVVEADWVVAMRGGDTVAEYGKAPELAWLQAFLAGSEHLEGIDDAAPSDMVWAHLVASGMYVAAGRAELPIHERERVRVSLLGRLADALL